MYQLKKMCETTFKNVPIRWGLTGTIPKVKSDYYSLITGIGSILHHLDSKELQDKGILAKCNVSCIKLRDTVEFCDEKLLQSSTFQIL